jgi:nicotinate phosphoribosyltransferase
VADTPGAEFHPSLELPDDAIIVSKGTELDSDEYSVFGVPGVADRLRELGVQRLWVGGLAKDVCVENSVLDACKEGFEVHLLLDATRPVEPEQGRRAADDMREAGAILEPPGPDEAELATHPLYSLLLTDLYELKMAQAYWAEGMDEEAVFEIFFRELPERRNYVIAAGLDDVLRSLRHVHLRDRELAYLYSLGMFEPEFLESLRGFRFTGDVRALPEGTVVFPNEPIVQVRAPMLQAQLVETMILNQVHLQSVAASKAARVVRAAGGRTVVDFGTRRAHGTDAAVKVARACWLAGADGTSNVLAGQLFGLKVFGTMAHSYIQAHEDELAAFEAFTKQFPRTTLLVDTYDTLDGVRNVIELARRRGKDFQVRAVRLDSGDLADLAQKTRDLLDEAGLEEVKIFASSGLDEDKIARLIEAGAPIDGFGVGTKMVIAEDAPSLDVAYKLVEYAGRPRTKLSSSKVIYPGAKQIFRVTRDGRFDHDVLGRSDEALPGRPLLVEMMRQGKPTENAETTLEDARERCLAQMDQLPEALHKLAPADPPYRVKISDALQQCLDDLREAQHAG